jgi:hypothetical protein
LIKANTEIPDLETYNKAIAHLRTVSIEDGWDPLFGDKGLDLVAVLQDSPIPSMATAASEIQLLPFNDISLLTIE